MPAFAELDRIRANPEPAYPEYGEVRAAARRRNGGFADPCEIPLMDDVVRHRGFDWCTAVLGYPFPGTLNGVPYFDAAMLLEADGRGLDPPVPAKILRWRAEDEARAAERQAQKEEAQRRKWDRHNAALAAIHEAGVRVEVRPNLNAGHRSHGPANHFVPTVDAVSGRSKQHPAGIPLCERPGRRRPRTLGEPCDGPVDCVSCLDHAPKIRPAEGRTNGGPIMSNVAAALRQAAIDVENAPP